ncbi:M48 family metalloprotease [Streptomyces rhizosphaerihabitans]|uniref:M48 family metalloprotease n=1 Tax=Streptomyces rhizosphaerihabitans TaxID=1266770 RepID=UPI0021BFE385|nr:M48 family metalloprotease [Streptomyces rhizosphaerihabitans]MCT9010341.1 M48 family metalloprotease [Streptomyces rhizosphaerihabitans]
MAETPASGRQMEPSSGAYRPDPLTYPRSGLALLVLAGCALLSDAIVISRFAGWEPLHAVVLYLPIFLAVRRRPTRRYGRLAVLPKGHFTDLVERVGREMGLREPVTVLDASRLRHRGLRVDLWKGRPVLLVGSEQVEIARLQPLGGEAVVRHELSHVVNRDIPLRELTISFRRAYLSLIGVLVCVIGLRARATEPGRWIEAVFPVVWRAVVTVFLVVAVTRALLRTREYYADARSGAGAAPEVRGALIDMCRRQSPRRRGDRRARSVMAGARGLMRNHPDPRLRVQALEEPDTLMRLAPWDCFLAGAFAGMLSSAVGSAAQAFLPTAATPSSMREAMASGLVAGVPLGFFLCSALWRSCWHDLARSRNPRTASTALATAVGLLAGVPLAVSDSAVSAGSAAHVMSPLIDWRLVLATVVGTLLVFRWLADVAAAMWRRARPARAESDSTGPAASFRLQYRLALLPATVPICWLIAFLQHWRLANLAGRPNAGRTAFREFLLVPPYTALVLVLAAVLPAVIHRSDLARPGGTVTGWTRTGKGGAVGAAVALGALLVNPHFGSADIPWTARDASAGYVFVYLAFAVTACVVAARSSSFERGAHALRVTLVAGFTVTVVLTFSGAAQDVSQTALVATQLWAIPAAALGSLIAGRSRPRR